MKIFRRNGEIIPAGVSFALEQAVEIEEPIKVDGEITGTRPVRCNVTVTYPWNWLDLASPDDLKANGISVEEVPDPPAPPRQVRKSVIVSRLTDAQLEQALGLLTVRQQERWRAPDHPTVNADDPETIAIIRAVGADPELVLAPD